MIAGAILLICSYFVHSQLQVIDNPAHHTMGPKFAITEQEIEEHPCEFFIKVTGVDPSLQCSVVGEEDEDEYGTMIRLTQSFNGIPIQCSDIRLNINKEGHTSINGEYYITPPQLNGTLIEKETALNRSKEVMKEGEHVVLDLELEDDEVTYNDPELLLICPRSLNNGTLRPGYRTKVEHDYNGKAGSIFIDAETGEHLKTHSHTYDGITGKTDTSFYGRKSIDVTRYWYYYAFQRGKRELVGQQCSTQYCYYIKNTNKNKFGRGSDKAAMTAYWGAERVIDLLKSRFNRDSFDGQGSRIYVRGITQVNAFWTQNYGAGFAYIGSDLQSTDVVAHEIAHGIIRTTAGLIYQDEPGAINESIADFFGVYANWKINGGVNSWEIGPQSDAVNRSFKAPKDHGQPDTYKGENWYDGNLDYGGVHHNSGVANHVMYILSEGKRDKNDHGYVYNIGGIGIEKAIDICYRALLRYLTQNSQFYDAKSAFIWAASDLYGSSSIQKKITEKAFCAGGVGYCLN